MSQKNNDAQLRLFETSEETGQLPVTELVMASTNFGDQQTLALDGDVAPKPLGKTSEQLTALEQVLRSLKAETASILSAAIDISGEPYSTLQKVPTSLLRQARIQALGESPELAKPVTEEKPLAATKQLLQQTYRPWSEDRKLRNRGRKLNERINKRFSIPEFLHPALQEAVFENPEYYGVCPLPSEESCVIKPEQRLRWQRADEAKAYEALMREREQR